jgi:hypothetical protein
VGLRPLTEEQWLERGPTLASELALKRELLENVPDVVIAVRPEAAAASVEVREAIGNWLDTYAPQGDRPVVPGDHPLVEAARWVQEDLCVMQKSDQWRLTAACVCFPSRWNLSEKIGQTLDAIHAPVPGYQQQLSAPTKSVFDRLQPERPFWRLNWTLLDTPALHQPTSRRRAPVGDLEQWFFRVERQTIRALPASKAVLFTIRNYVTPLAELRDEPFFLEHLVAAIEQAPVETQDYKGWRGVAEVLRTAIA